MSPFITPDDRFVFPAETYAAAEALRSPGIAKLMQRRLKNVDGLDVGRLAPRLIQLNDNLRLWATFVRSASTSPVRTSYGEFTIADAPSIHAAIDILQPILAAVRGEVLIEEKAA